jgi:hypothetical protein
VGIEINKRKGATIRYSSTMFTQGGEDRRGGSDQLQKVKDRDGAQGRREETRKI